MRAIAATLFVMIGLSATQPAVAAPDPWHLKQRMGQLRDANAELRQQLRELRREHSRLATENGELRDARDLATLAATTAARERDSMSGQVNELQRRLTAADEEIRVLKETLVGELPDRVGYVARQGDFSLLHNAVLRPALANWPCHGSLYSGRMLVSYDFDMYAAPGDCY